ncbi:MAG: hypothetical protein KOO61_04980 [Spirochaetales bacterium]|nr:hypothetical protein [Spirochaetales bacterium]
MSAITLQPKRTWLLMRNQLSVARTPAILIAAASGVALILYVLTSIGGGSPAFHLTVYPILLFALGYIVSSFSFQEIHDPRTGVYELTSPGSIIEKYVARILLTSIGWAVAVTLAYMLTTAIGAGIAELIFGESHGIFVPNNGVFWEMTTTYLVSQSIFVFGSIYFKKSAFLKTVLVMVMFAVIYAIFLAIAARLIYWNVFTGIFPTEAEMNALFAVIEPQAIRLGDVLERILDYVGWIAVPIFFWFVGYVRLRETEV